METVECGGLPTIKLPFTNFQAQVGLTFLRAGAFIDFRF